MNEVKWAIITGADGGMGTEITRAVATAGYHVIMACYNPQKRKRVPTFNERNRKSEFGSTRY